MREGTGGQSALRRPSRRLHSITGIVPVGAFVLIHLASNWTARRGADAYDRMAGDLQRFPFAAAIEVFLIALPIVFHGVYGLYLAAASPAGAPSPTPARRLLSIVQRATGVIVFAFLFFHLWTTRLVQFRDHGSLDLFRLVQAAVASGWIRLFYAAAIVSAGFHLAVGIWTFPGTWGWSPGRTARGALGIAAAAVFLFCCVVGLTSLAAFKL